jgi:hypothetical protein
VKGKSHVNQYILLTLYNAMGIWLWDEDQENGSENSFYQDMKLKVPVRG